MTNEPRLDELRRLLEQVPTFTAPRSQTLTPFPGEQPVLVRGKDGGWIRYAHAASAADEQPPRVEPKR